MSVLQGRKREWRHHDNQKRKKKKVYRKRHKRRLRPQPRSPTEHPTWGASRASSVFWQIPRPIREEEMTQQSQRRQQQLRVSAFGGGGAIRQQGGLGSGSVASFGCGGWLWARGGCAWRAAWLGWEDHEAIGQWNPKGGSTSSSSSSKWGWMAMAMARGRGDARGKPSAEEGSKVEEDAKRWDFRV